MSCLNISIPKKLKQLPSSSKKAWKSFTSSIHLKLRHLRNHLNIPSSVTTTARRLLHLRPKRRPRIGRTHGSLSYNYYYRRQQYCQYQHFQQSPSVPASPATTIYVDRLFGESSKTRAPGPASTSAGHDTRRRNEGHENEDVAEAEQRRRQKVGNNDIDRKIERWKEHISSIRGVDERAEEFISKFKQQMQLQREQSILDFQQMLARSA